ncbi:MAG: single-stranded DNA-binding protein [Clostridia bacterium]|nr:single-stranded DNA-binding protein [Clostridia bacterium]
MSGLNQVVLIGNLARDPELRYTPDGTPVTSFTIAVNRTFVNRQGEREADFVPIVVWRKRAETCSEYLMKGSQVAVEGRLQVRNYEDKDGIRKWVTEVVARRVDFLQRLKKQFSSQISEEETQNEIDRVPLVEEKKGNDTPSDE